MAQLHIFFFIFLFIFVTVCCEKQEVINDKVIEDTIYSILENMTRPENISIERRFNLSKSNKATDFLPMCKICEFIAWFMTFIIDVNVGKESILNALSKFCQLYYSDKTCRGLIELNYGIILYIIQNKSNINSQDICNIIAQTFDCASYTKNEWNINIPKLSNKSISINHQNSKKPLRILHLTDIHYDPKYRIGYNRKCRDPICCGYDQGISKNPKTAAGPWGEYETCDMPLNSVENFVYESAKHKVDIVYFTGDIIAHRIWETSPEQVKQDLKQIYDLFKKYFPNTPIFPIIGNHDSHPTNVFAPKNINNEFSTQWLYEFVNNEWRTWLPEDTNKTILEGGYYTVLVRPGFRIIVLNSNIAYIFNWWLMYNQQYLQNQLQWLSDALDNAEKNNEFVHILSHIPAADPEIYRTWNIEYFKIVNRFSHLIKAQFVGHTHIDEFYLFYNENSDVPFNVEFNGGSFNTYTNVNPQFRIYQVNPETYDIQDFEEWIYDVSEANKYNETVPPKWFKLYSFKQAYNISSMTLSELGKLVIKMSNDKHLLQTYSNLSVRNAQPSLQKGCDSSCKEELLCKIVNHHFRESRMCRKLKKNLRKQNFWGIKDIFN